jgi:hypothetical protein
VKHFCQIIAQGSVNGENALILKKGFLFQLSDKDRQNAKDPSGPQNPQALNRYSYVLNNPLRYTDPTGHYNYTFNWFIGWVDGGVTPAGVMKELKENAQDYFPFRITPLNGCTVIAAGCLYELDPGIPGSAPYTVLVVDVTDTSFTFVVTACSGSHCFAEIGSTITFSTYESGGATYLQQHGVTQPCSGIIDCEIQKAEVQGAYATWFNMAVRMYQHYHNGIPPGMLPAMGCFYWAQSGPCLF